MENQELQKHCASAIFKVQSPTPRIRIHKSTIVEIFKLKPVLHTYIRMEDSNFILRLSCVINVCDLHRGEPRNKTYSP